MKKIIDMTLLHQTSTNCVQEKEFVVIKSISKLIMNKE